MDMESFPQYLRIALDLASRVAEGELQEGQKFSGRSLLSSHYHVSPETVRKALRLLAEMQVVAVKEKSGAVVLSAERARKFLDTFQNRQEQQRLHDSLQELLHRQSELNHQISEVCDKLLQAQRTPLPSEKCPPSYEVTVSSASGKIGASIGSLHFWQATGATIIAIRRNQNTILSPGPYAELHAGDVVVFVGAPSAAAAVSHFLNES